MERIPQHRTTVEDVLTSGEARRSLRRDMENEAMAKASGKATLSNIILALLVALAAAASMLGIKFTWGTIGDVTALSILLYIITSMVYRNRYDRGKMRGKLDGDYRLALQGYRDKRTAIDAFGILGLVPQFCREYKVKELREYRSDLLVDVDMTYEEYEECYLRMSDREVSELRLPLETRKVLIRCNHAKPLRLTPGMILNENGEAERHKLLGQSGREREHKDKRRQMLQRAVIILFGTFIGFDIVTDFSLQNILRWVVRMLPIAIAIISGDDEGYCNVTVTEATFKRGQSAVIQMLFEWAGVVEPPSVGRDAEEQIAEGTLNE